MLFLFFLHLSFYPRWGRSIILFEWQCKDTKSENVTSYFLTLSHTWKPMVRRENRYYRRFASEWIPCCSCRIRSHGASAEDRDFAESNASDEHFPPRVMNGGNRAEPVPASYSFLMSILFLMFKYYTYGLKVTYLRVESNILTGWK